MRILRVSLTPSPDGVLLRERNVSHPLSQHNSVSDSGLFEVVEVIIHTAFPEPSDTQQSSEPVSSKGNVIDCGCQKRTLGSFTAASHVDRNPSATPERWSHILIKDSRDVTHCHC